jgi:transketolase C-terminal domain/subunit
MRTPSAVLYGPDFEFRFGKGWYVHGDTDAEVVIVSSGRGVHEAIAAARLCESRHMTAAVVDMASIDEDLLIDLCTSNRLICLAEQNNGYILQNLLKLHYRRLSSNLAGALERVVALNTLDAEGRPRFIHSGTYEELIDAFGLTPAGIAGAIERALNR